MTNWAALLPGALPVSPETIDSAPAVAGAYILLIHLPHPVDVAIGKVAGHLPAGWHAYAGSANGPGGLRARLRRHFRRDKAVHWHVDRLTLLADRLAALAVPGESECALGRALAGAGLGEPALAGFGSSDCAICATHLLRWTAGQPPV